jgi:hypothetical protein
VPACRCATLRWLDRQQWEGSVPIAQIPFRPKNRPKCYWRRVQPIPLCYEGYRWLCVGAVYLALLKCSIPNGHLILSLDCSPAPIKLRGG